MIYNGSYIKDVSNILAFIDGFSEKYNLNIGGATQMGVDVITLETVARVINDPKSFPHNDGIEKASAFKKVAHFMVWFVSERPIINPFKIKSKQAGNLPIYSGTDNPVSLYNPEASIRIAIVAV